MFIYCVPGLYSSYSCNSVRSFFPKGGGPINASISLYVKVSFFRRVSASYIYDEKIY